MAGRTILQGATLFDGERPPRPATVVLAGARIEAVVDPGIPLPISPDDRTLDLAGRFVMPGLISCHLHPDNLLFGLSNFLAGEQLGRERPAGVLMAVGVRTCRMLLETGFTGYVGAACSHNIDAQLKMAIDEEIVPGPRIRPCSHHIGTTGDNNDSPRWWARHPDPGIDRFADGPDALRALVRDEIRCGARIIKIYASSGQAIPNRRGDRNMSRREIEAVVEAAHERGVPVRAHVVQRALIEECVALGIDVIDHGNEMDEACLDAMAPSGTFWVPSLLYSKVALDRGADPDGPYGAAWQNVRRMIPAAQARGVRLLPGDDYGGGAMRHDVGVYARELSLYVEETGLAPIDVLRWATINAGALLGDVPGETGIVAAGAHADLIILAADPTRDITILEHPAANLVEVCYGGRFYREGIGASRLE